MGKPFRKLKELRKLGKLKTIALWVFSLFNFSPLNAFLLLYPFTFIPLFQFESVWRETHTRRGYVNGLFAMPTFHFGAYFYVWGYFFDIFAVFSAKILGFALHFEI